MSEWYKDWFDTEYYNLLYSHRNFDEAREFVENITNYLKLYPMSKVLDLACGEGRHSLVFYNLGMDVVGVDISQSKISKALLYQNDYLNFYTSDMRDKYRYNYFDLVVNLFTSFGYFNCDKMETKIAKSIFTNLKPNGYFLIDYLNTSRITGLVDEQEEKVIDNVEFKITKFVKGNWIVKEIIVCEGNKCRIFEEHVKLYSMDELKRLFEQVGLKFQKAFGNYKMSDYLESESERMILLFKK
ncbi:MAG: class I SAM-dependent methyltransferase [Saprospiraceae bacterium]|nr:class I SAM-dependent methyltransferase [Saprospiraceae bacterium]